jgi:hypothetical protein
MAERRSVILKCVLGSDAGGGEAVANERECVFWSMLRGSRGRRQIENEDMVATVIQVLV